MRKKSFSVSSWCFCLFLVVVRPFSGVQNRKKIEIFLVGIDLEWSETHFKPKISRKNFSSSFKIFRMATQKFSGQFEGSKAGKTKYLKKLPVQNFSGCRSLQFEIGRLLDRIQPYLHPVLKNPYRVVAYCIVMESNNTYL